jgi:predicted MFS family arabinose efflux permease
MGTKTSIMGGEEKRFITPTLFLAGFVTNPAYIASSLLLIDIAETFQKPLGAMSQINTGYSVLGIFAALTIAALSVKYQHKHLMQVGLAMIALSAVGCYLATNYQTMLIVFSLAGIGSSIVNPMNRSLVGEHIPHERQAQAIGWLIAGSSLSYLVSAPLMAYITNISDWRTVFLIYILPVTLLSIIVAHIFLPKKNNASSSNPWYNIPQSFVTVLTNSSALSTLLGSALIATAFQAILVYSASFYREIFGLDRSFASNIVVLGAFTFTAGSVGSSRITGLFGKKKAIISSCLLGSLFIGLYANIPEFWSSMAARLLGGLFVGVAFSGLSAMLLGQIPQFRGTVMSLDAAIRSVGTAVGTLIGGTLLLTGGYSQVSIVLASFGVLGALIVYLRTKET